VHVSPDRVGRRGDLTQSPCPYEGRGSEGLLGICVLLAMLLLILPACGTAATPPKRILVMQSFGLDFAPYHAFSSQFRSQLARYWPHPTEYHQVALESDLLGQAQAEGPFLDYLVALYGERPPDLVVPIGGPAARFIQKYRGRLFQDTPMLIVAADQRHFEAKALTERDAVVASRMDLPGLVENILDVLPQTTQLYVVLGASPLERFWQSELQRELEPFANRLAVTYWSDLAFDEIQRQAALLPLGSAILYGLLLVDADGISHEQSQTLAALHSVANAPIFGVFDSDLGAGIVGGPLIPVATVSQKSAAVAARILAGEAPPSLQTPPTGPAGPIFDWRELGRWGIPEARLPEGSEVRFREPSLWEHYRWRILGVAFLIVIQALLIIGLLINQVARRRAERRLSESEDRLALAADDLGIWVWDGIGDRVTGNAKWREMFGLAPEGALTLGTVVDRIHPADRAGVLGAIRRSLAERSPYLGEFRVDLADGTSRWLSARARPESREPAPGGRLLGATIDITERKAAEDSARDLSRRLIQSQEQERARIARELHDDMSQRLARLAIDAGRVERDPADAGARELLEGVRQGLVRLSDDVHALSYRLHPTVLMDLGLGEALRIECEQYARIAGATAVLSVRDRPGSVPADQALCLFRVAQEALQNCARHARAREVKVTLTGVADGLQLVVQDDGVGFDPGNQAEGPRLGLAGMRERVSLLGGEIDVESLPGLGTVVLAWVPFGGSPS
jgi:PAS domain S-box-containing protein